jgi:Fe-S-cluster containining protein
MGYIQFKCERCGFCCRTLLENDPDYLIGLSLFPDEVKLFDPKIIAPFTAFGINKPTNITSYQLTVATCPHINEANQCKIYENRPLVCKAFPIIPEFPNSKIAPKCPQISHHTSYRENGSSLFDAEESENAVREIYIRGFTEMQNTEKGSKLWVYDLATKRWLVKKP